MKYYNLPRLMGCFMGIYSVWKSFMKHPGINWWNFRSITRPKARCSHPKVQRPDGWGFGHSCHLFRLCGVPRLWVMWKNPAIVTRLWVSHISIVYIYIPYDSHIIPIYLVIIPWTRFFPMAHPTETKDTAEMQSAHRAAGSQWSGHRKWLKYGF